MSSRSKSASLGAGMSLLLVLGAGAAHAQAAADPQLAKVLAEMDAAAAKFQSAQADFSWDQLTAVVQEHDVQKGTIAFKRSGGATEMVVHVLTEEGAAHPKDVLFRDGQLAFYNPEIKQETLLEAGKNRGQFETYATLGFGGSGRDLQLNWKVTYAGSETVDGVACAKLDLAPKKPSPDQMFTKVDIWIDPATATSRKQVFYASGGDTRTALYSNIRLNAAPESLFKLKIPSGTNVIRK